MPNDNDYPEGTTAFLLGQIAANQKSQNEKLDKLLESDTDQDARITSLEHDRSKTLGAAGVISAISAFVLSWFFNGK